MRNRDPSRVTDLVPHPACRSPGSESPKTEARSGRGNLRSEEWRDCVRGEGATTRARHGRASDHNPTHWQGRPGGRCRRLGPYVNLFVGNLCRLCPSADLSGGMAQAAGVSARHPAELGMSAQTLQRSQAPLSGFDRTGKPFGHPAVARFRPDRRACRPQLRRGGGTVARLLRW